MGFLKKALGQFVEMQDDAPKASKPMSQRMQSDEPSPSSPKTRVTQEDTQRFQKHFEDLMDGANLPGPDYYELDKTMEALEAAIPDEGARRVAAFATLKVSGIKKDVILSSAQSYIKIIQDDRDKFQAAVEGKIKKEVEARKDKLAQMEEEIAEKSKQIQDLTKEISSLQSSTEKTKTEIEEADAKIRANSDSFLAMSDAVIQKITADVKKIQTQIKE